MDINGITADSLKAKSIKIGIINGHVAELLRACLQDAHEANENHMSSCSVKIPLTFEVPGLSFAKAQMLIYYQLIQQLESRGFRVSIDKSTNLWTISGWDTTCDTTLDTNMLELIASRCKRKIDK